MAEEQKIKLSDGEKQILIAFYEVNNPLWSSEAKFKNKEEKNATKEEMKLLFHHK